MEKSKVFFLRRFQQKPKKAYILLLGVNVLREIISFLTYTEFIDFSLACKKFFKFLNDKYLKFPFIAPSALFIEEKLITIPILERKSIELLGKNIFPGVNSEWKNFQFIFFHYVIHDTSKLIFIYHDRHFEIKELVNFATDFRPAFSRIFNEPILIAKGYKNKVLLAFRSKIEQLIISESEISLNEECTHSKAYTYNYPNTEKSAVDMEFINNGKHLVIVFKEAIYLLTEKMHLLNIHRIKDVKFTLLVPNKEGKNYIAYTNIEIKIYRLNTSQEVNIKSERTIFQVLAVNIKKTPQLVYTNDWGEIYLTRNYINRRCQGKIFIIKEFIVYQDYTYRDKILVVNLESNTIVYDLKTSDNAYSEIVDCSAYKLFYLQNKRYYLHSLIKKSTFPFTFPFETVISMKFLNNLLIINGRIGKNHGIIVMDFYRELEMASYQQAIESPFKIIVLKEE